MKLWRYIVIPAAVFVVGLFLFSRILNQSVEDLTTEMPEATVPVVYMMEDGERINELHGYAQEMDASSVRDTITPVEIGGALPISIDTYGSEIQSISYEIRSLDTTRLIQQSDAENLAFGEDQVTADLPIQNFLTERTEYLLVLQVTSSGNPWYFYTRIIEENTSNLDECISFVRSFHEITMSKTRQSELTDYMETSSEADNDTLQSVTLKNTLSQVCWGNMRGTETSEPVVSVKEINDAYNVILLDYVLSSADENENLEYYSVEEYYRVRRGEERVYLLDFERTVEEIFRGQDEGSPSNELILGIRSADVDYMANETATVVCFVQSGELWSYNIGSNRLTLIFSFRSMDGIDARENFNEYDIRILRTNETGSVDFVVYGYMNRGTHEGEVGVSVCHFDSATSTVQEQVFLPTSDAYPLLQTEIGQAMYVTESGMFYLVMGDQLYCVDPDKGESSVEISGLAEGNYACSEGGRYFAWIEGDESEATTMHLIDLETGRSSDIDAPDGCRIRPLGFLDSDCIYGLANDADISADSGVFPMNRVVVVDFSNPELSVLKTYDETDNAFVTGAQLRDGNIYLEKMTLKDGKYEPAEDDVIYNREMHEALEISVVETYSDIKQTEVALQLPETVTAEPEVQETRLIFSNNTGLRLFDEVNTDTYLVYARGRVIFTTDQLVDAVECADENAGVVIGTGQVYIWKDAAGVSAALEYPSAETEVSDGMEIDLTGCTLDQVLHYVGNGIPVYGVENGRNVVITGYNSESVTLYDPAEGESEKQNRETASEEFAAGGNVFTVTLAE